MIGHIFYIIGIILLLISISMSFKYFEFFNVKMWIISFKRVTKKLPLRKEFRKPEDYNLYFKFSMLFGMEIAWLGLGLATKSWQLFVILTILSMLNIQILKLDWCEGNCKRLTKLISSSIYFAKIILIGLLIINHFHLHKDLYHFYKLGY